LFRTFSNKKNGLINGISKKKVRKKENGGVLCVPEDEWMDYGSVVYLGFHLSLSISLTAPNFPMKKESPETIDFSAFFPRSLSTYTHTHKAGEEGEKCCDICPVPQQHFPFQLAFFVCLVGIN
jgi:hypothetical protein